jgi:hypothetical protein
MVSFTISVSHLIFPLVKSCQIIHPSEWPFMTEFKQKDKRGNVFTHALQAVQWLGSRVALLPVKISSSLIEELYEM